ncbi:TPA: FRG domain-containing protein [Stenotrophomonas maltophilia]|jgi:hypothetical protein|nr:FRG domain-containing protein [Stenotrophomonas maltophilia]HDS1534588.1 FRG domain-containing protein [Stenotrophomonas maltophilia]
MNNTIQAEEGESVQSKYFEEVPLWNKEGAIKRFEVLADRLSGRIPVTRLESWREFAELLECGFFNGRDLIFRGHRRADWGLMPTLARIPANNIITSDLANLQLERFKLAVRGRLSDYALVEHGQEEELWAIGQHHGLMTPLLDWTYSPYVALFFAFHKEDIDEEKDNDYRAIYMLNKSFLKEYEDETGIRVIEPRKDHHGRLVNQAGLFTYSPYDSTIENKLVDFLSGDDSPDERLKKAVQETEDIKPESSEDEAEILASYICKIYIRNEERDACMRHLRRMNVHHASLFPDLLGASEYCNILAAEAEAELMAELGRLAKTTETTLTVSSIDSVTALASPSIAEAGIKNAIEHILRAPVDAAQVEPGRIELMAQELTQSLEVNMAVDWGDRAAVQARLRNGARVILRKLGYPFGLRDAIVEQIMEAVMQQAAEGK